MINETDTQAQPPEPPTTLKLGELIALLIEAGVSFDFAYRSEGKPGKHFMGEVNEQRALGDDPVSTLLEAVAIGVRSEADADAKTREMLDQSAARIAKINALLPGLQAHAPVGNSDRCSCGQKRDHAGPGQMISSFLRSAGLVVVSGEDAEEPEPGKKKAH